LVSRSFRENKAREKEAKSFAGEALFKKEQVVEAFGSGSEKIGGLQVGLFTT
jgi:hypothetical protein